MTRLAHATPMQCGSIMICPVDERTDLDYLWSWWNDFERVHLWTGDRVTLSFEEFTQQFRDLLRLKYLAFFVVKQISTAGSRPIGMIYAYDANLHDGHTHISVFIDDKPMAGPKAMALFLDYLFSFFPLRKVYFEVYDYNQVSSRIFSRKDSGCEFTHEATLRGHRFYNGAYHDLRIFSFSCDQIEKIRHFLERSGRNSR